MQVPRAAGVPALGEADRVAFLRITLYKCVLD